MEIEKFVRNPIGLTYLVVKKKLVQDLIIDNELDCELDEIEVRMLKNELEFIELELKLITLKLKRESIMASKNIKTSDHHFKKMSEYKYTLEFVEPRKSYEELQKENNRLKLVLKKIKQASELFKNSVQLIEYIDKIVKVHLFR